MIASAASELGSAERLHLLRSPYDSPKSFAAMSMIFETVGASAYLGGAKFLENKDYLTAAAVTTSFH